MNPNPKASLGLTPAEDGNLAGKEEARARAKKSAKAIAPAPKKRKKAAPTAQKKAAKANGEAKAPRADSKKAKAIEMLREGVTAAKLQKKFGWQAHTVRGFISVLGKTMTISSEVIDGERTYQAK